MFLNQDDRCNRNRLLSRLDGVRASGPGRWMARCPSHKDRTASLSIRETDDGRILLNCFGGCGVDDITAAVGLTTADLFPKRPSPSREKGRRSDVPPFDWQGYRDSCRTTLQAIALLVEDIAAGRDPSADDLLFLDRESSRLLALLDLGEVTR